MEIDRKTEAIISLILLFSGILVITTSFGFLIKFIFGMELFYKFEEAITFLFIISGGLLIFLITLIYMIYLYSKD
jgi:hypothetical protein